MTGGNRKFYSLREIAERFGGEVVGDSSVKVDQVATLEAAAPGTIAFLSSDRYLSQLKATRAEAVIVGESARAATRIPRIVCANPYAYFARVSGLFNPGRAPRPGVHPTAVIDPDAVVAGGVEIGPHVVVGPGVRIDADCIIGAGCCIQESVSIGEASRLHPNVTLYQDCAVGKRVILHSGVVIGADGFGIAREEEGWIKIPQVGRVIIGDDVEIGANTTVDRGALDDTVIEEGVKLDNQIQVGHNVRIGARTAIAACVGIAGSARIGCDCRIGGGSGIAGHLSIADGVTISAYTLITKSIDKAGTYTGAYPFEPHGEWRRNAVHLRRLDELADRVRALEKKPKKPKRSKA